MEKAATVPKVSTFWIKLQKQSFVHVQVRVGYSTSCTPTGMESRNNNINIYNNNSNNNNNDNNNILFRHSTLFFSDSRAESSYCQLSL